MPTNLGKALIFSGLVLIFLGLIFIWGQKIPWFGKLPGDIYIQRKNFSLFFPLASCILISIILSLIFWLLSRRWIIRLRLRIILSELSESRDEIS